MPLYSRKRDFTTSTLNDIRNNFKGDTSTYRELSLWWAANEEVFDYANPVDDIRYLEDSMTEFRYFMSEKMPNTLNSIETNVRSIDANFVGKTNGITNEVRTYGRVVDTLITSISDPDFAFNFDKKAVLELIYLVDPDLLNRRTTQQNFVDNLKNQYGFDNETAQIMWKLWLATQEYYSDVWPDNEERNKQYQEWAFNRLLGSLWYGEDGSGDNFQWAHIAGPNLYYDFFYPTQDVLFVELLGLSDEEYKKLRAAVRMQYLISGMDHEVSFAEILEDSKNGGEGYALFVQEMELLYGRELSDAELKAEWDRIVSQYTCKTDFAHQSIATATWMASSLWPFNVIGGIATGGRIGEMASWLGDATLKPYIFGNDDYMADLDACNVYYYMTEYNLAYMDAFNRYYSELNNGGNRATVFLAHTSIESVELEILNRLCPYPILTAQEWGLCRSSEEARRAYIDDRIGGNEKYADTYRFLQSLWEQSNTMVP